MQIRKALLAVSILIGSLGPLTGCATHYSAGYRFQAAPGSTTNDVRKRVFDALEQVCHDFGFEREVAESPYALRFYRNPKSPAKKGTDLEGSDSRVQVAFSTEQEGIGIWDPSHADETPFVKAVRMDIEDRLVAIVGRENVEFKRDRLIALGP